MKYQKEIAQNTLRATREKLGLTQKDVAKKMGCAIATIESWEKGTSKPQTRNLLRLCALYKIQINDAYPALYQKLKKELEVRMKKLKQLKKQKK